LLNINKKKVINKKASIKSYIKKPPWRRKYSRGGFFYFSALRPQGVDPFWESSISLN